MTEPTAATRDEAEDLLLHEADLLDDGDLTGWLSLFTADGVYHVPGSGERGAPTTALLDDDHARLEDRVWRLTSGAAHAQIPPSRTCRFVSGVRVDNGVLVRSRLLIVEVRGGERRTFAARVEHRVRRVDGALRIAAKIVHLVDAALAQRNLTFIL